MGVAFGLLPKTGVHGSRGEARPLHRLGERALILGSGPLAHTLIETIQARKDLHGTVVGVTADSGVDFGRVVDETRPDRIVVALDDHRGRLPVEQLLDARARGTVVEDAAEAYERLTGKLALECVTPSSLVFSRGFRMSGAHAVLARALGLVMSVLGLAVLAPLLGLIGLLIKLDSRGPVLFVQERVGLHGKPFRLIKFRTMRARAQGTSEWERDNYDRITRLGRWLRRYRLDELPQLVNVLRGDMNLVGPRPHPVTNLQLFVLTLRNMNERTGDAIPYYSLRCAVRPGITGWAQVRYGYANGLDEEVEKIRYDLYYLRHMSFWLDLRILVDTLKITFSGKPLGHRQTRGRVRNTNLTPEGSL